jgi:hypothetical protein
MLQRSWWLLPLALCALLYATTLSDGFLADDYTYLVSLSWWADDGRMLARVLANFGAGIDAGSHYYRPLPIASFALNFLAGGADPVGWRGVNLALHLACGALLAAVVASLARRDGAPADARVRFGAATAAAVFVLSPASPEVAAWVSGRFDSLALVFMLVSLLGLVRSARWNDRWGLLGLAAALAAFASKESATLLPVLVLALAVAPRAAPGDGQAVGGGVPAAVVAALRRAAPWLLLLAVYFGWRIVLFGTPFRVYPDSEPAAVLVGGGWIATLATSAQWLRATLPDPVARVAFGLALAIVLVIGGAWCLAQRALRLRWLALDPQGESARLFYVAAAALALLVALPCVVSVAQRPWLWNRALRAVFVGATAVGVAAEALLLRAALAPWHEAGAQSKRLVTALAELAARLPADGYGFVLVPDRIGGVPFGRLAQGGLTLPPVQRAPLLAHLVVQTEPDLAAWPENLRRGVVDALKRYPPREVWAAVAAGRARPGVAPTDYYCWDTGAARLVALTPPAPAADAHWLADWRAALAASPCRALAAGVPRS